MYSERDELQRFKKSDKTADERFWQKVDMSGDCWLWTGCRNKAGYGSFSVRHSDNRFEVTRAHRYSWQLVHGSIPHGMFVCHQCDNPSCIRPEHLFLGTPTDNMRDCVAKGRSARQKNRYIGKTERKLTAAKVSAIRAGYTGRYGEKTEIARAHGVTLSTIRHILMRKIWQQVA